MTKERTFQAGLCAVTFLPLVGFPLAALFGGPFDLESTSWNFSIIFVAYCHVAATGFFYLDRDAKDLRRVHDRFFILIPLVLVVCVGLAFQYGSNPVRAAINVIHFGWLFYHYQKQNYGVISFSLRGLPRRVANDLWHMLLLAAVSGFFSYIRVFIGDGNIHPGDLLSRFTGVESFALTDFFFAVALAAYAGSALLLVKILTASPEIRRNGISLAFTLGGFAFFLPTFMAESGALVIFWSYSLAHALQYFIFMGVTAAPTGAGAKTSFPLSRFIPLLTLAVVTLVGGAFLTFAREYAYGVAIGLNWGHFVIDSRVWKLRQAESRAYILRKFSFLF